MIYKWNIFFADLNPVIGSEQKVIRPVLIISDEDYSTLMPVVTILPITSLKSKRKIYLNEVLINAEQENIAGLTGNSIILAHQIRTISKKRLINNIGKIEDLEIKHNIDEALRIHLNL